MEKETRLQVLKDKHLNKTFGNIKIIDIDIKNMSGKDIPIATYKCSCGKVKKVYIHHIINGKIKSCGCKNIEKLIEYNKENMLVEGTRLNTLYAKTPSTNSSGVKGVRLVKLKNGAVKYNAFINFQKRFIYLGLYDNIEDARKAREKAEEKYFQPLLEKYGKLKSTD